MIKVSVIIPVYNIPETQLHASIRSVLSQTEKELEVIIVDDGSTNDSLSVCRAYEIYSNVIVLHQDNQGVSVARNTGLERSSGEWIMFLDPDDELKPNAVSTLLSAACDSDDIVACGCDVVTNGISEPLAFFPNDICFSDVQSKKQFYYHALWRVSNLCAPWGKIFRHTFLIKNKLLFNASLRRAQDIIFNLYAVFYARNFRYISERLYIYNGDHIKGFHTNYNPSLADYYLRFAESRYKWMCDTSAFSDSDIVLYYKLGAYKILYQILSVGPFHKNNNTSGRDKNCIADFFRSAQCFSFMDKEPVDYSCLRFRERIYYKFLKKRFWIAVSTINKIFGL